MADVFFENPFAARGHKFAKGLQSVPDELLRDVPLPKSARIVDEDQAEAIRAELKRRAKAAEDPKTLKEMRSGRKALRPMGKQDQPAGPKVEKPTEPSPSTSDGPAGQVGDLRKVYRETFGKNASPKWSAEELQQKIADAHF